MNDDDRIGYLAGDDVALPADERDELDGLRDLLGDPSLWADPPAELEDRVAAAVAAAATTAPRLVPAPDAPPMSVPHAVARRRVAWRIAGVAAAVVVAVGLTASVLARRGASGERFDMALASPTGAATPSTGTAHLTRTASGWRIELDAPGLPRLDGGRFYEAWLRNAAGVLVPVGTFNEGTHVVLWAGVSPRDFPTLTVTEEEADGDQASSGRRVLSGSVVAGG